MPGAHASLVALKVVNDSPIPAEVTVRVMASISESSGAVANSRPPGMTLGPSCTNILPSAAPISQMVMPGLNPIAPANTAVSASRLSE